MLYRRSRRNKKTNFQSAKRTCLRNAGLNRIIVAADAPHAGRRRRAAVVIQIAGQSRRSCIRAVLRDPPHAQPLAPRLGRRRRRARRCIRTETALASTTASQLLKRKRTCSEFCSSTNLLSPSTVETATEFDIARRRCF
ncbi:hypothetical protein EVAR_26968_1 [Eumeta japonica]|uniref:Uncharacterized protein n=1 Tax=Eumeta variegata TaxID=151549 RepID=A0A4C1VLA0_EUMVA|nr:hypothetical protein EVAR_26968_1 [Eumeta japonica]